MGNLLQLPKDSLQENSAKTYRKGLICQECCLGHEPQFIPLDSYEAPPSSHHDSSNPPSPIRNSRLSSSLSIDLGIEKQDELQSRKLIQLELSDGGIFIGEAVGGIPQGKGQQRHPSGDSYEGDFHKGLKHGRGCYTFSNQQRYEGDWRDNKMHGHGRLQFVNGDWYQGQFQNNQRHGKGKYYMRQPNQEGLEYFQGEYVTDKKHGMGMMKYHDHEFYGTWKEGEFRHALNSHPDWNPDSE